MPRREDIQRMVEDLYEVDKQALVAIYRHRCLTPTLLCRHIYNKHEEFIGHGPEQIQVLQDMGCLEAVDYGQEEPALFLTQLGIMAARRSMTYESPKELTVSLLKMNKFLIPHQMSLNTVAYEIEEQAKERNIPYEYHDAKFLISGTQQINIMPDGVFRFNGCDVFLEMDMRTEETKDILSKWDHYRAWTETDEFLYKENKTIILFLLCNIKKPKIRQETVLKTINKGLLDKMSPRLDFYVGTPEELVPFLFDWLIDPSALQKKVLPVLRSLSGLGYSTALGSSINQYLNDTEFGFYTRMISPRTHKIIVKDGRAQEFLCDIISNRTPGSVLNKAAFLKSALLPAKTRLGREIPYLIIGETEDNLVFDMRTANILGMENVFFTTAERLEKAVILPEAVFQVDQMGRKYHFSDFSFENQTFEKGV